MMRRTVNHSKSGLRMAAVLAILCVGASLNTQAGRIHDQVNGPIAPQAGPGTAPTSVPEAGSTAFLLAAGIGGLMLWKKKAGAVRVHAR